MQGKHAQYTEEDGNVQNQTLASLSLDAFPLMSGDPMYAFFRHAFDVVGEKLEGDMPGIFDGFPVEEYANTLVRDLFESSKLEPIPEAIISLNVWMYIVHQLYDILRACQRNDNTSESDMMKALDVAAALWIGAGQEPRDNDTGNMLYNLAEKAAARFGQEENGEAFANGKFIESMLDIKVSIDTKVCQFDSISASIQLRIIIRRMIGYMTIPLVQMLIHHVMEVATTKTSDFIELYALAIGARVKACMPNAFSEMLELFVTKDFTNSEETAAIELIQSVYPCLEITCKMVGAYRTGRACIDNVDVESLTFAGYPINSDARNVCRTLLVSTDCCMPC